MKYYYCCINNNNRSLCVLGGGTKEGFLEEEPFELDLKDLGRFHTWDE